jgi:hypothetical protein
MVGEFALLKVYIFIWMRKVRELPLQPNWTGLVI